MPMRVEAFSLYEQARMARPTLVFCMMNIKISSATAETTIISRLSTPREIPPMLMRLSKIGG